MSKVYTTKSFDPNAPQIEVAELDWYELTGLLNDHKAWKSVHGSNSTEAGIQFNLWSKPQIRALQREVNKRLHDRSRCPVCGDADHIRPKRYEPLKRLPQCGRHGCTFYGKKWIFRCEKCNQNVDELVGLFVPYLCKPCEEAVAKWQRENNRVCSLCRQPLVRCCC